MLFGLSLTSFIMSFVNFRSGLKLMDVLDTNVIQFPDEKKPEPSKKEDKPADGQPPAADAGIVLGGGDQLELEEKYKKALDKEEETLDDDQKETFETFRGLIKLT